MGSATRIRAAISNNPTREKADDDIGTIDDDGETTATHGTFTLCGGPFEVT
jgi:hypothetical protein